MILAIIQARMSSGRLKKKVLKKIDNQEVIKIIYKKLKRINLIKDVIIATSNNRLDDDIENFCLKNNMNIFRGSLENVLERFYYASLTKMPNHILRITGDCPLIDEKIIKKIINCHLKNNNNYTSNTIDPYYPDGMDAEIFDFNSLVKTYLNTKKKYEKEHVTPYIYENQKKFKIMNVKNRRNLSNYRITLDYIEDYQLICKIIRLLKKEKLQNNLNNIISVIDKYDLHKINSKYTRNESFINDKKKEKNF